MNYTFGIIIVIILICLVHLISRKKENFAMPNASLPVICITCPKESLTSRRINWAYADSIGYEFEVTNNKDKFKSVKELLELDLYKYVLWIDDRVFFNTFEKRIEDVFFKDETKDIIVFANKVMLVKNTPESINMMNSGTLIGKSVLFINELPSVLTDHAAYSDEYTQEWIESRKDLFPVFD